MSKYRKFPVGLFPPLAILTGAEAMAVGAQKHGGEYNWRSKKESLTNLIDGIIRHALAWRDGEELSPDDGVSHAGHILARAAIAVDAASMGMLTDDRPRLNTVTGEIIEAWEEDKSGPAPAPQEKPVQGLQQVAPVWVAQGSFDVVTGPSFDPIRAR